MRLMHMLTEEIVILRMSLTENSKMAYSTVTAIKASIQPLDDDKSSIADGVFGKSFTCYTDGEIALFPGDKLRDDDDNNVYTVKSGGATRRQHGRIGYQKVIIELT